MVLEKFENRGRSTADWNGEIAKARHSPTEGEEGREPSVSAVRKSWKLFDRCKARQGKRGENARKRNGKEEKPKGPKWKWQRNARKKMGRKNASEK